MQQPPIPKYQRLILSLMMVLLFYTYCNGKSVSTQKNDTPTNNSRKKRRESGTSIYNNSRQLTINGNNQVGGDDKLRRSKKSIIASTARLFESDFGSSNRAFFSNKAVHRERTNGARGAAAATSKYSTANRVIAIYDFNSTDAAILSAETMRSKNPKHWAPKMNNGLVGDATHHNPHILKDDSGQSKPWNFNRVAIHRRLSEVENDTDGKYKSTYLPNLQMEIFEFVPSAEGGGGPRRLQSDQENMIGKYISILRDHLDVGEVLVDEYAEILRVNDDNNINNNSREFSKQTTKKLRQTNVESKKKSRKKPSKSTSSQGNNTKWLSDNTSTSPYRKLQVPSAPIQSSSGASQSYLDALSLSSQLRNDAYLYKQWYIFDIHKKYRPLDSYDIQALEAWRIYKPLLNTITIGVIDSGAHVRHLDLGGGSRNSGAGSSGIWRNNKEIEGNGIDDDENGYADDINGYDFKNDSGKINDSIHGHGTHIAGIVSGTPHNKRGITGVCPNCKSMILKFIDETGFGYWGDAIKAIEYALSNNVLITCNSYGTYQPHKGLYEAIKRAGTLGMLFVAAAGNDSVNTDVIPKYPSAYNLSNILSVASIGRSGKLSWFSNYGYAGVDIAAPGEQIYSTSGADANNPGGSSFRFESGTSMSAPIVAGIAGMIWSSDPTLTYRDVKNTIIKTLTPIVNDKKPLPIKYSGTVNAYKALKLTNAVVELKKNKGSEVKCGVNDPCHVSANCVSAGDNEPLKCACKPGFIGDGYVECADVNECLRAGQPGGADCGSNSECVNIMGSYRCECESGYIENQDGACSRSSLCRFYNPCNANADCYGGPAFGLPLCKCRKGFIGDGTTDCHDVDECQINNGGCSDKCVNTIGSYKCECKPGYTLVDERHCEEINECEDRNGGCSDICVNTDGGHECKCKEGFELQSDGKTCIDIDECSLDNGGCSYSCVDHVGGYTCECPDGYELDHTERICVDTDECQHSNGGCEQLCINIQGSYKCGCFEGYGISNDIRSSEQFCIDEDECQYNNGGCEYACKNKIGSYECLCDKGHKLGPDGKSCIDIDECESPNNPCEQVCVNTKGEYECECHEGFVLNADKTTCRDKNECIANNGGCDHRCTNTLGGYKCSCMEGHSLMKDMHTCESTSCGLPPPNANASLMCNNGYPLTKPTCIVKCKKGYRLVKNTLTCTSEGEWTGVSECEDIDECLANNGGCSDICVNVNGGFRCECPNGYKLDTLTRATVYNNKLIVKKRSSACSDIDECATNNGGCSQSCMNKPGGFSCGCFKGYTPSSLYTNTCIDINECLRSPCHPKASCRDTIGGFTCTCQSGYEGDGFHCQNIDECNVMTNGPDNNININSKCGINAACVDTEGGYNCVCKDGYEGDGYNCKRRMIFQRRKTRERIGNTYSKGTIWRSKQRETDI